MSMGMGVTAIAILFAASMHVRAEGERALRACDVAIAASEWPEAIRTAKDAARSRVPFTSIADDGFGRLDAIATTAESAHDAARMTSAFGAMQEAADSTEQETWRAHASEGLLRAATIEGSVWRGNSPDACAHSAHCVDAMKISLATETRSNVLMRVSLAALLLVIAAISLRFTRTSSGRRQQRL